MSETPIVEIEGQSGVGLNTVNINRRIPLNREHLEF